MAVIVLFLVPLNSFSVSANTTDLSENSLVEDSEDELEGNSLVDTKDIKEESDEEGTETDSDVESSGDYEITESEDGSISAKTTNINPLFAALAVIGGIGLIASFFIGGKKK